eukprot:2852553-Prymnesium_polylepis.1
MLQLLRLQRRERRHAAQRALRVDGCRMHLHGAEGAPVERPQLARLRPEAAQGRRPRPIKAEGASNRPRFESQRSYAMMVALRGFA